MAAHYYSSAMSYRRRQLVFWLWRIGKPIGQEVKIRKERRRRLPQGPLDVGGSVKSGRSITLTGDFTIEDKMEAYGSIDMHGKVTCGGKIKAAGNIIVTGYLAAHDKMKSYGKLKIRGLVMLPTSRCTETSLLMDTYVTYYILKHKQ
ncbi:unnamed protein product [Parascedosporium putredinis]|uniref:Uncharacterized protein n=1 Tax=Parascedosporium putredinis TaxID=1442378 RepID=A0A9P1M845_9PEZI|nr:unnamed protein product [Parascedosporium putredinis]CAI7989215.1 unnamed protein product [Parascedosporium putredinis]